MMATEPALAESTPKRRLSVRRLLVMVAVVAVACTLLHVVLATYLATFVVVWGFSDEPSRWKATEGAGAVAWAMTAALAFSAVYVNPFWLLFLLATGLLQALCWVLRLVSRRRSFHWSDYRATPLCFLIGGILLCTDIDFRMRLAVSQPALRNYASRMKVGENWTTDRPIGLLWVHHVEKGRGFALFHTDSFFDEVGVAYIPSQVPPAALSQHKFQHIRGPWFRYDFRW